MKAKPNRVGVRELRQNLSVYLARIAEGGEAYQVTEHGRPVAILAAIPDGSTATARLVADGRATAARGNLAELKQPRGPRSLRLSAALSLARAERVGESRS